MGEVQQYIKSVFPDWEPNPKKADILCEVCKLLRETGTSNVVSGYPTVVIKTTSKFYVYAWDGDDTVLAKCVTPREECWSLHRLSEWVKWTDFNQPFEYNKYETEQVEPSNK